MTSETTIRFSAIGLNYGHIYGQVDALLQAGNARAAELLNGAEILACFARSDSAALRPTAPCPRLTCTPCRRTCWRDAAWSFGSSRAPIGQTSASVLSGRGCRHPKPSLVIVFCWFLLYNECQLSLTMIPLT